MSRPTTWRVYRGSAPRRVYVVDAPNVYRALDIAADIAGWPDLDDVRADAEPRTPDPDGWHALDAIVSRRA